MIKIKNSLGLKIMGLPFIFFMLLDSAYLWMPEAILWKIAFFMFNIGITDPMFDFSKYVVYALFFHSLIHSISVNNGEVRSEKQ